MDVGRAGTGGSLSTSLIDPRAAERLLLVAAALRSGLVDALADGPASSRDVAVRAKLDIRATRIVLDALVAEELVERVGLQYALAPVARRHLLPAQEESERWAILHQAGKLRGWLDLPSILETGHPEPKNPGKRDLRTFVYAMAERSPALLDEIVERCLAYAGRVETMLDVGGAVGHVARRFSQCGVRATLLDREDVLSLAREYLGPDADDIALVAADFTVELPTGPFGLVYLGNVYHIYGPRTNDAMTRHVYSIIHPGGSIAIHDHVMGRSRRAPMFAVNMLQATEEGGVWTGAQYRCWLKDAGFADIQILDVENAPGQLILGRRPHEA